MGKSRPAPKPSPKPEPEEAIKTIVEAKTNPAKAMELAKNVNQELNQEEQKKKQNQQPLNPIPTPEPGKKKEEEPAPEEEVKKPKKKQDNEAEEKPRKDDEQRGESYKLGAKLVELYSDVKQAYKDTASQRKQIEDYFKGPKQESKQEDKPTKEAESPKKENDLSLSTVLDKGKQFLNEQAQSKPEGPKPQANAGKEQQPQPQAKEQPDYYKILNVDPSANQNEIKKAYHKKALETHPDKAADKSTATQQFQDVKQAFDVLSDPSKKASYDAMRPKPEPGGKSKEKENTNVEISSKENNFTHKYNGNIDSLTRSFENTIKQNDPNFTNGARDFSTKKSNDDVSVKQYGGYEMQVNNKDNTAKFSFPSNDIKEGFIKNNLDSNKLSDPKGKPEFMEEAVQKVKEPVMQNKLK